MILNEYEVLIFSFLGATLFLLLFCGVLKNQRKQDIIYLIISSLFLIPAYFVLFYSNKRNSNYELYILSITFAIYFFITPFIYFFGDIFLNRNGDFSVKMKNAIYYFSIYFLACLFIVPYFGKRIDRYYEAKEDNIMIENGKKILAEKERLKKETLKIQ